MMMSQLRDHPLLMIKMKMMIQTMNKLYLIRKEELSTRLRHQKLKCQKRTWRKTKTSKKNVIKILLGLSKSNKEETQD